MSPGPETAEVVEHAPAGDTVASNGENPTCFHIWGLGSRVTGFGLRGSSAVPRRAYPSAVPRRACPSAVSRRAYQSSRGGPIHHPKAGLSVIPRRTYPSSRGGPIRHPEAGLSGIPRRAYPSAPARRSPRTAKSYSSSSLFSSQVLEGP